MKAIVYTRYGPPDVLQLREIERPTPESDRVLVRIHAASVNAYDWHMLRGKPFLVRTSGSGLLKPKITVLGADIAGTVEAVGSEAWQFKPGDMHQILDLKDRAIVVQSVKPFNGASNIEYNYSSGWPQVRLIPIE